METQAPERSLIEKFRKYEFGDILIVGGGISGIQAALDAATEGYRVYLVESSPSIGGRMAQLDKTFPTNDCSMCIESPKLVECSRHPNIEVLTYTEVEGIEGNMGDFKATLVKRPRYIKEDKCTGCGTCTQHCPVSVPDPYNQNLSTSKAIHVYLSQAVPLVSYIDPDHCLFLQSGRCGICSEVCENKAIDFYEEPKRFEIKFGAVILAPGYEIFDAGAVERYAYGRFDNVVTSLDFERLLCSTGPFEGEIQRPSDGRTPEKIAWIQCVGSRRLSEGDNPYCSAVCCAYTQKQVLLSKDHDPDLKATVFHNDIRSFGKDFDRFFQRTNALDGVQFIRSYVSIVHQDPETKNVTIRYTTEEGVKEDEFELVVLSVGLKGPKQAEELAHKFGIDIDDFGFCSNNGPNPIATSRPGIFIIGAFQGPKDIPESVYTASGATSLCSELLKDKRGRLARERVFPEERDVSQEETKIGVFVCHCGANIGRVVDVPSVVEYAYTLDGVAYAEDRLFACSTDSAQQITDIIKEKALNRVIIAACTPRTHEPLFMDTLSEAGINPCLCEMANIREHDSWVHPMEKEKATKKAKDLVRMAVSRVKYLEPLQGFRLSVDKRSLVVGGGIAGMTCALSIARDGFEVFLVEREKELGGNAGRLFYTLNQWDVQEYLKEIKSEVYKNPLIHVMTGAELVDSTGYLGNFTTKVRMGNEVREIKHGVAVIATGAQEYQPDEYYYGQNENVITLLELEKMIADGDERILKASSLSVILCVGCRNKDRNYCSRVCCGQAIKNVLKLKEINPNLEVNVLYRDMMTYGFKENYYKEAAFKGVKFFRYEADKGPEVELIDNSGRKVPRINVYDPVLGHDVAIDTDILTLGVGVVPQEDNKRVASLFKVPLSTDGFFQEAHVKLRPVDFAAEGIFLCGMAHYPKDISESISQAYGAAGRLKTYLTQDSILASGSVCEVDEDECVACGACISVCKYDAIEFADTPKGQKARVNPLLCKGDGLCNSRCPTGAIKLKHFTDTQIFSQIDACMAE